MTGRILPKRDDEPSWLDQWPEYSDADAVEEKPDQLSPHGDKLDDVKVPTIRAGTWADGTPKYLSRAGAPVPPEYVDRTWPLATSSGVFDIPCPPIHNDPFEITNEFLAFQAEHGRRIRELRPDYFCQRKVDGKPCGGWLNYYKVCGTCVWRFARVAEANGRLPEAPTKASNVKEPERSNYTCVNCRKGFKTWAKHEQHRAAGCFAVPKD